MNRQGETPTAVLAAREAWSAAKWCAQRGYDGRPGSPLPEALSLRASIRYCRGPYFVEMVRRARAWLDTPAKVCYGESARQDTPKEARG